MTTALEALSGMLAIFPWKDAQGNEHPEVTAARAVLAEAERGEPAPCQLYIAKLQGGNDVDTVRIEARDGPKLLGRIEIDMTDFARALMGLGALPATFATTRSKRP